MNKKKIVYSIYFFAVLIIFLSGCAVKVEETTQISPVSVSDETAKSEDVIVSVPVAEDTASDETRVPIEPVAQEIQTPAEPSTQETQTPAAVPEAKEFKLIAKNWEFVPSTVTVKNGDKVRLLVTSEDVNHGIAIPDYGVNVKLAPGKEESIEFTADKVGEFRIYCSVFCGSGHGSMTGKLIVTD